MTKELEVSHWGSIAIEEIYELKHAGAKLKGGLADLIIKQEKILNILPHHSEV